MMEIGSIRNGYLAKLDKYPDDEKRVFVMRNRGNDKLAPSEELLSDYKELEEKLEDRWEAWKRCRYESRFREEMRRGKSRRRVEEIAEKVADGKDVRLVCYEKDPPCHRFVLKELVRKKVVEIIVPEGELGKRTVGGRGKQ